MDVFRVREGRAAGLGIGRMRGPGFAAPYWGVRASSAPVTHAERAIAFSPRLPRRAFFSGASAAALWGIPLPRRLQEDPLLDVAVPAGARRLEATGVRAHHLEIAPADVGQVRGIRVTTMARTWRDLANVGLTRAELVAAGDHVLRRSRRSDVERVVAAAAGRRGGRTLRTTLPLLDERAESPAESRLRIALLDAGLPRPDVNARIVGHDGVVLGRPDFSWRRQRVVLEYEGDHHRTDPDQWRSDLRRFARFQQHGWVSLRASADDLWRPERLLAQLADILAARESTQIG